MMSQFFTYTPTNEQLDVQRRSVLKFGLAGVIASTVPLISTKHALASSSYATWRISFRHARTGESFSGVYRVGDKYLPEAFERLSYVMRDFRTNEVFPMDPRVVDILSLIHRKMDIGEPYETLSGYRSPKTNSMLRHETAGVASNSFHMYGQAVDVRLPNYSTDKLRRAALSLKAGGVGYYPRSNFVHVDTGKVRTW
jgi:uncharacterized protein YcbK (DUF882 family)